MKLLNTLQMVILAGIPATAAPVGDGLNNQPASTLKCPGRQDQQNIKSSAPYALVPELASGYECTSDASDSCSIANSATYTKTTTWTVSGAAFPGFTVAEVFTAAMSAGFSYSWAESEATGTSATVTCPPGNLQCGILATTYVIKTTGQVRTLYPNMEGCPQNTDWQDFEIVAPYLSDPSAPKGQQVKMDFMACLDTCSGNSCNSKAAQSLRKCDPKAEVKDALTPPASAGISLGPS